MRYYLTAPQKKAKMFEEQFDVLRIIKASTLTNQPINDLTPGTAVSNCLPNKIREHENPVDFLFSINKRLQIFSQAIEIQLRAPRKQSVTQLFFISDGHFSIQIIKNSPPIFPAEKQHQKNRGPSAGCG